ncbi:MAG TPA: NnrS family protein, partial [Paracoccaceae bacterium]
RALALLWLLARASLALAGHLPFGLLLAGALAYFVALSGVLGHHILAARTRRKAGLGLTGLALAAGDALFLANWFGSPGWADAPLVATLAFAFLISLIGGRAVPAFTQSWLEQTDAPALARDSRTLSLLALGGLISGALLALGDARGAAGLCLVGAGALQFAQMAGWHSLRARRSPALLMLHLAWLWLPLGLMLAGLALARPDLIALPAALHALTMGAMGTMVLAIMGRAAMARRRGTLIAGHGLTIAFALVWLAALLRVLAPFAPPEGPDPIRAAALLWMSGWALFLWAFRPALRGPVPRPVLGAPRAR